MPGNLEAAFVTQQKSKGTGPVHGSSLYYVTKSFVFRCSGNSQDGRTPTTFIRKRSIEYVLDHKDETEVGLPAPVVGRTPVDEAHVGNAIVAVLTNDAFIGTTTPPGWVETGGVSWTVARNEIKEAMSYVIAHPKTTRAEREVGQKSFVVQ